MTERKVISASRRIDMVGCFPDAFVDVLHDKCPPERVHTLVIWTKDPAPMFTHPRLSQTLSQYDQLFVHLTVTGMGGTEFEPRVPQPDQVMRYLPRLVALTGDPMRIRFRFDPIVHLKTDDGRLYCNLDWFQRLAPEIRTAGVTQVSISWMSVYRKVIHRLRRLHIEAVQPEPPRLRAEQEIVQSVAGQHGLQLHYCSMPGFPRSRCIDGLLLNQLHPHGYTCSVRKARGQRTECGCTESWDIGWYFKCPHGCVYCYANPDVQFPAIHKNFY